MASPRVRPAVGFAGTATVETFECDAPRTGSRPLPTPARSSRLPPAAYGVNGAEDSTIHDQDVLWRGPARSLPSETLAACDIFTSDERRRSFDFNSELLELVSKSQPEVKVLQLDKALVRKQISLADHLPGERCTGGDGPKSPRSLVAEVSPSHFARPEISAKPSIVHFARSGPLS